MRPLASRTSSSRCSTSVRQRKSAGEHWTGEFQVIATDRAIRPEVIPTMFESFTQADRSLTRQVGSRRLGLALMRRRCRPPGGDCGVKRDPGKGSRFGFSLPLQYGTPAVLPHATSETRVLHPADAYGELARQQVLRVEENLIDQELAAGLLDLLGCDYTVDRNGRIAVELLPRAHDIGIVMMDCQRLQRDGFESTPRVREGEPAHGPHIPLVARTATTMTEDRQMCLASGLDDFLGKPFPLRDPQGVIDTWRRRQLRVPHNLTSEIPA